jgi:Uma2 family endonuclease
MTMATVVHRFSVEDVFRMYEAGVLDERQRLELVEGVLVEMTPIGPEHDAAVEWLAERLTVAASGHWRVRVQSVLLTAHGFLLPALMVVEPLPRDRQPTTALLVVEVAQTSQARDAEKAAEYAGAGVADYWIADLERRVVTVHREPRDGGYALVTTHADGEQIAPLAGPPLPAVDVAGLCG